MLESSVPVHFYTRHCLCVFVQSTVKTSHRCPSLSVVWPCLHGSDPPHTGRDMLKVMSSETTCAISFPGRSAVAMSLERLGVALGNKRMSDKITMHSHCVFEQRDSRTTAHRAELAWLFRRPLISTLWIGLHRGVFQSYIHPFTDRCIYLCLQNLKIVSITLSIIITALPYT